MVKETTIKTQVVAGMAATFIVKKLYINDKHFN